MAQKDVYIAFGGDASGIEAAAVKSQVAMRAAQREMVNLAQQMQRTGATVDSELGKKFDEASRRMSAARAEWIASQSALRNLGKGAEEAGKGVEKAGHAHGNATMQMMESIHVAKAFVDEIVAGQNPLRALALEGGRIFQILSMGVSATMANWGALGAVVLAAAGSFAYLVMQAREFKATSDQLRTSAAFGGMGVSQDTADKVTATLQKISGLSWKEAQEVMTALGTMEGKSEEVFKAISGDIDGFSKAFGDKPLEAAKKLIAMFADSKLSADQLSKAVGGDLSAAMREQYERASQAANPLERQAALQAILASRIADLTKKLIADREAQIASAEARKRRDDAEIARHGTLSGYARDDLDFVNNTIVALKAEIAALKAANDQAAKMPDLIRASSTAAEQLRIKFDEVLRSASGAAEAEKLAAGIETLRAGLQGATGDAATLLRRFEGFQEVAKWDVNHFRAGYGSDTRTSASGAVSNVAEGDVVSREDAERDLARRIAETQAVLQRQLGASWDAISDKAKASLISVAYNYGHLPADIAAAARSGDRAIADAIAGRAGDNNGVNAGRRRQEAANITGDYAAVTDPAKAAAAADAIAAMADKQRQLNDARNGGDALARAELQNAEAAAKGGADQVAAQERIVAAWQKKLDLAQGVEARSAAEKGLAEATHELLNRQNAAKESGLRLDAARAKSNGDYAAEKAADLALADFKIGLAGKDVAAKNAAETEKATIVQRYAEQDKQTAMQTAQDAISAAQKETGATLKELELRLKAREITEAQKFALTQQAYAKERAAMLAAFQSELQIADLTLKERKKIQDEIAAVERDYAQKSKEVQLEAADDSAKVWKDNADRIAGAFNSQVGGLLRGTTSWADAAKNVVADMAEGMIKNFIKIGLEWAANEVRMVSAHATGAATKKAIDATTIQGDAGRAAAGAYAAVAGVPFIGPVLAPAAAAAAYAGTLAFASFDIGAWSIPEDQLAMVHRNELVMPAAEAGAFRSMLSGAATGGAGGGQNVAINPTVQIHTSAIDGAGVAAFWRDNQRGLMRAVDEAVRHGAHLGLRRLAPT